MLRLGMHEAVPELPSSPHGLIFNGTRNFKLRFPLWYFLLFLTAISVD